MSDCHVTCTKCGWELDSSGRCGHCGRKHKFTVTAQSNDYLYIESGEKEKIIMQQQEKIAELQKRIDELEKQLAWIQVSDRLPETYETVLVALGKGVTEARYSKPHKFVGMCHGWHAVDGYCFGNKVTHWRPLPQPPEVKNE